jgi:hypothetical protein
MENNLLAWMQATMYALVIVGLAVEIAGNWPRGG